MGPEFPEIKELFIALAVHLLYPIYIGGSQNGAHSELDNKISRPVGISLQSPTGKSLDRPRYTGPVLSLPRTLYLEPCETPEASSLAASKTDGIRSLLINYGPMVPITEEDRWGVFPKKISGALDGSAKTCDKDWASKEQA